MLAALICGLAGCAGFVYTFVPRDGQQPLSAKNSGLPVIFTVGNVVGDLGSFATSSPIDLNSQQLSALNSMNESSPIYSAWFASRHIIYTDKITIELQAQGNRNQTVRIINIFPVEKCTSPLTGTLFYNPPQGEDMSAQLSLDLNNPTKPAGFQQPGSSMIIPDYFGRYSISLPDNGQQTFEISAAVANRSCQFTLDADLIVNNQTVTETISNNGQPFAVTAQGEFASYRALYLGGPTSESLTGGKTNQYQDDLWIRENPKTYK